MTTNRRSVNVLSSTGNVMNQYSQQIEADSYYGFTDGLHTIQCTYNNFSGSLHIQGTLSLDPVDNEWFDIVPDIVYGNSFEVTDSGTYNTLDSITESQAYTFTGNFTYVRVYMDRTRIGDGETYQSGYGQIVRAILSS